MKLHLINDLTKYGSCLKRKLSGTECLNIFSTRYIGNPGHRDRINVYVVKYPSQYIKLSRNAVRLLVADPDIYSASEQGCSKRLRPPGTTEI